MASGSMTFRTLIRQPSAFLPIAMSAAALALVVGFLARYGIVRQADEGAAARVFQLLIVAQLPIIAFFAARRLPAHTRPAALVLALQIGAAMLAVLTVLLLEM